MAVRQTTQLAVTRVLAEQVQLVANIQKRKKGVVLLSRPTVLRLYAVAGTPNVRLLGQPTLRPVRPTSLYVESPNRSNLHLCFS